MTNSQGRNKSTPTSTDYSRRELLKRGLLAATTTSAMTSSPLVNAEPGAPPVSADDCGDFKVPMKDVEGKVAFITGGSSGIGLGIARAFADAGMKVAISYRTKAHLDQALPYLESARERIHAISVDVTDRQGMQSAAAETARVFGKIHVLVNNAGVAAYKPFSKSSPADWDWVIGVNLIGVINGIHAFLPYIQAHKEGGHIVSTASTLGLFAISSLATYSATKFAVVGLTEALRAELAEANIGVSVFCPGAVTSNIGESSRNYPKEPTAAGNTPGAPAKGAENGLRLAQDTLEAGVCVLRGMQSNALYILMNPEYEQVIQSRHEVLIASMPKNTGKPHLLDQQWFVKEAGMYSAEKKRSRCRSPAQPSAGPDTSPAGGRTSARGKGF